MTQKPGNTGKKKRMSLREYIRSSAALRVLICLIGIAVTVAIFEVAIVPMRYNLEIGMVPTSTIAATKDVVDELSTEQSGARPLPPLCPPIVIRKA